MGWEPNPKLEENVKRAFMEALVDGGEILQDKVKDNAPVDSGDLRKSIEINVEDLDDLEIRVESDEDYAAAVEFGTTFKAANPFMRTALAESKNRILKEFKDIL